MAENDKRTATQRLEDIESVLAIIYQNVGEHKNVIENLLKSQGDLSLVKDALKLLNKELRAIVESARPETGITPESISALVTKMNVQDMMEQVAGHVKAGTLVPAVTIAADSYLVVEELDNNGVVVNPRSQLGLDGQDKALVDALIGKSTGDVVPMGTDKLSIKVLEVYTIVDPKVAAANADAAAEAANVAATATTPATSSDATSTDSVPAAPVPTAAAVGPSNDNFQATPPETPVQTFVTAPLTDPSTAPVAASGATGS